MTARAIGAVPGGTIRDLGDHGRIFDSGDDRQGTAATRRHCAMSISNTRLRKPSLAFALRAGVRRSKPAPGGFVSNWAKLRRTGAEGWGGSALPASGNRSCYTTTQIIDVNDGAVHTR
jgi:hypothetical protein